MTKKAMAVESTPVKVGDRDTEQFTGIKSRILCMVSEDEDNKPRRQVETLVDYVGGILPVSEDYEMEFINMVFRKATSFINASENDNERHHRLLGLSRLLQSLLAQEVERSDDEYINTRFESLTTSLDDLVRLDLDSKSANNRMTCIYDGFLELALVFGLTDANEFCP